MDTWCPIELEKYECKTIEKKELWTEQNGHLSRGKTMPKMKGCSC